MKVFVLGLKTGKVFTRKGETITEIIAGLSDSELESIEFVGEDTHMASQFILSRAKISNAIEVGVDTASKVQKKVTKTSGTVFSKVKAFSEKIKKKS